MQAESRKSNRLICSLAISRTDSGAPLGEITNLSLDGLFIATRSNPLPLGAAVPVVFAVPPQKGRVRALAEVARINEDGIGLRFLRMSDADSRKLRRHVVHLLSTQGAHDNAMRLLDTSARTVHPITSAKKIKQLLESATGPLTIISSDKRHQATAKLAGLSETHIVVEPDRPTLYKVGQDVIVIYVHEHVSYSFKTSIDQIQPKSIALHLPREIVYSERRAKQRTQAENNATVSLEMPWSPLQVVTFPVFEFGDGGLSFLADPNGTFFLQGSKLPPVIFTNNGSSVTIKHATVRHITQIRDPSLGARLRVGISFDIERQEFAVSSKHMDVDAHGVMDRILSLGSDLKSRLSYIYHSKKPNADLHDNNHMVVEFNNKSGKKVVGLLDCSFSFTKQRIRAPLLIVIPGFGGRKETMSPLANIIVDNWRRNFRDIAVFRFDGTNNLGESEKDPGCEGEGRHNLRFTVSGAIDDLLATLEWAKNNKIFDPTSITFFSVSIGAISARRVLTLPEASWVSNWISFMGAADVANTGMRGAGNVDFIGNYERGIKTGIISLNGCISDADHFSEDACKTRVASLDDARRDMASVAANVTWFIGKPDAYVDPKRVYDIMSAKSTGRREVIELNAGHVPRHGDEALAQFSLISQHLWGELYGTSMKSVVPSKGRLAAKEQKEWQRVRHGMQSTAQEWWRDYLLGENAIGFDAWSFTKEYRQLMLDQAALAAGSGSVVHALDAGAGTGNMSLALANAGIRSITAVDLVPEALEKLKSKLPGKDVATLARSVDGGPLVALNRWLTGDLGNIQNLVERMPSAFATCLKAVADEMSEELHAVLRGAPLDIQQVIKKAGLPISIAPQLKALSELARHINGVSGLPRPDMDKDAEKLFKTSRGLPFRDNSFDVVLCSLVLSYLDYPSDALFELRRVLKPGCRAVVSSMLPDMDGSKAFVDAVYEIEAAREVDLPAGFTKESLLAALRSFSDKSAKLLQLEEDGSFKFYSEDELAQMLKIAGFEQVTTRVSCGEPGMAIIAVGTKV